MENIKHITSTSIKKIVGDPFNKYVNATWHSMTIHIKRLLSLQEYIDAIVSTLDMCTGNDGARAVILVDFAFRVCVISAYAFVEMPDDINDLYALAYESGIYELIYSVANNAQIEAIRECIMRFAETGGDNSWLQTTTGRQP